MKYHVNYRRTGRWLLAACIIGVSLGAAGVVRGGLTRDPGPPAPPAIPAEQRAPDGIRIRVAVLNASAERGLARRAAAFVRDRGYDVVETGNARDRRDSTVILDHSGHPEWAARMAKAFGGARVESRPDSSRYLDISILIGAAWRPPARPLYP